MFVNKVMTKFIQHFAGFQYLTTWQRNEKGKCVSVGIREECPARPNQPPYRLDGAHPAQCSTYASSLATTGPRPPAISPDSSRKPSYSLCKSTANYSAWLSSIGWLRSWYRHSIPIFIFLFFWLGKNLVDTFSRAQQQYGYITKANTIGDYIRNNNRACIFQHCHTEQLQNSLSRLKPTETTWTMSLSMPPLFRTSRP